MQTRRWEGWDSKAPMARWSTSKGSGARQQATCLPAKFGANPSWPFFLVTKEKNTKCWFAMFSLATIPLLFEVVWVLMLGLLWEGRERKETGKERKQREERERE